MFFKNSMARYMRVWLFAGVSLTGFPITSYAATFTVNSNLDTQDAQPGDTLCKDAYGQCTLRAAITEANAASSSDVIQLANDTYYLSLTDTGDENNNLSGDLDIKYFLTIQGVAGQNVSIISALPHATGIATSRVFHLLPSSKATFKNVVIRDGDAEDDYIGYGGGIYVGQDATISLNDTTLTKNDADYGGGLMADNGTTVDLTAVTVSYNNADFRGGGIHTKGTRHLALTNVTISENLFSGINIIGAISTDDYPYDDVIFNNVTIANNDAYGITGSDAIITLKNSVIANHTNLDAYVYCLFNSEGGNWIETPDDYCDAEFIESDHLGADPLLGPLANNGGLVQTQLPSGSSGLIDQAVDCENSNGAAISKDARGTTRPQDGNNDSVAECDIGAVEVKNTAPVVSMTSPATNSSYLTTSSIPLAATASDENGVISKVEFFANGVSKCVDTSAPYNCYTKLTTAGSYTLAAKATDNTGKVTSSTPVYVNVTNAPPTVTLTSPTNGATYSKPSQITMNTTASDADGIERVEFYLNDKWIGSDTTSPYSFITQKLSAGDYTLYSKAYDKKGASSQSNSATIKVLSMNP